MNEMPPGSEDSCYESDGPSADAVITPGRFLNLEDVSLQELADWPPDRHTTRVPLSDIIDGYMPDGPDKPGESDEAWPPPSGPRRDIEPM